MAKPADLPPAYKSFLESHSGKQPYLYEDNDWWLATSDGLQANVNIDGQEYVYIRQLQAYAKSFAEFFEEDCTTDADDNEYPLTRLEAGLAIAEANGDVLYLDPADDYSVWCFYHDGGDVEKVAASFGDWIAEAQLDEDY